VRGSKPRGPIPPPSHIRSTAEIRRAREKPTVRKALTVATRFMSKIDILKIYRYIQGVVTVRAAKECGAMDQMNVSITDRLASYVRRQVKGGRYNNASEVVREALRRMEDEDARAVRLAKPTAEDILTDLTGQQLEGIRRRVLAGIESIETGEYTQYEGREGLTELSERVKARGRKLLAREAAGH